MTRLPDNFDFDNFLDMYKTTLTAVLGLIFKKQYKDAMNKCIQAVKTIESLKEKQ